MTFDVAGALAAGYSPDEVLAHLAEQGPDATGAGASKRGPLSAPQVLADPRFHSRP